VDGGFVTVLVVLDVFLQSALLVYGKDVAISSVVVKRVAIDVVWRLLRWKQKDGSRLCVDVIGLG